jgi:large subunit ribosomal protein L29
MAILRMKKIRELSSEELKSKLAELRLDLAKDRAQVAVGGTPVNPGKVREVRRTIARILTALEERARKKPK